MEKHVHEWELVDQIPCWYHVGEGCFETMYVCTRCETDKQGHVYNELEFDKENERQKRITEYEEDTMGMTKEEKHNYTISRYKEQKKGLEENV